MVFAITCKSLSVMKCTWRWNEGNTRLCMQCNRGAYVTIEYLVLECSKYEDDDYCNVPVVGELCCTSFSMNAGLSEAELLERARAERAAIVNKYVRGRTDGDNEGPEEIAPPWEDPQYEDYHVTDKWGFIHDTRLPVTHTKEEARSIEVEANRMLKWNKMTKSWDKYHGSNVKHRSGGGHSKNIASHHQISDKLYNRIYKGIPARFRGDVWAKLLDLPTVKEQQRGKYDVSVAVLTGLCGCAGRLVWLCWQACVAVLAGLCGSADRLVWQC
ncbi:hypothetical protein FHG87_008725 [Trinorchestia longiramus]|nr:hypothetical protein FHG87_008725 [Trinorchestia longiramus]